MEQMNNDIRVEGEELWMPRKGGGWIKWPINMIWSAGFDYWWRNVPNRGLSEERKADVYKVLLRSR